MQYQAIPLRALWLGLLAVAFAAVVPASPSPRLFLDEAGVAELRARLDQPPFAQRWRQLRATADYFVAQPGINEGASSAVWSRGSLGAASVCSFAYLMTGDRRYGERAKREIWSVIERPTWRVPKVWNKGADLNSAEASVACALFYDWAGEVLTAEERAHLQERLLVLGIRPYLDSVEQAHDWWVDNPVTNWDGVCHGGSGLAALALRDVSPEAQRAWESARTHVPAFLEHVVGLDGDGHEGVMYWRYGVEYSLIFATAAQRAAPGPEWDGLFARLRERLAGYWDIAMQASDERYANFNDMNEETYAGLYANDPANFEGGPNAALCALFERTSAGSGETAGADPLLLWAADHGGAPNFYRGISPFWFLWRRPVPPSGPKPALPDAMLFRTSGHTIWKAPDFWLAFNSGWVSDKSHYNSDLGSFILVSRGERFVVDPGYDRHATADHATLNFDDRDQPKGAQARYLAWMQGKDFRYLASDLSGCYDEKVRRCHRHLVLVGGNILVLVDDIAAADGTKIEWNLPTRFPVTVAGDRAVLQGGKSSLHVVSATGGATLGVSRRNDLNYLSLTPASVAGETLLVTVLVPSAPGAPAPTVAWHDEQGGRLLTVDDAGRKFSIRLRRADDWRIEAVNDEPLGERAVPTARTFARIPPRS